MWGQRVAHRLALGSSLPCRPSHETRCRADPPGGHLGRPRVRRVASPAWPSRGSSAGPARACSSSTATRSASARRRRARRRRSGSSNLGLEGVDPPDVRRARRPHPAARRPLAAAVDVLDLRLPRAVRAAATPRATPPSRRRRSTGADGRTPSTPTAATSRAPLVVDALGWRRVLSDAPEPDPAAGGAALARPGGAPARRAARTSSCGSTRATCARATAGASRPATSCASASARSTRATTSRSRRCALAGDLSVRGRALPGQLDPAPAARRRRGRRVLRRRLRRPLPAARPPRASAPRSTSASPAGASCARSSRAASRASEALARYAAFCAERRRAFDWLLRVQSLVSRVNPTPLMTPIVAGDGPPPLPALVVRPLPRHRAAVVRARGRPGRAVEQARGARPGLVALSRGRRARRPTASRAIPASLAAVTGAFSTPSSPNWSTTTDIVSWAAIVAAVTPPAPRVRTVTSDGADVDRAEAGRPANQYQGRPRASATWPRPPLASAATDDERGGPDQRTTARRPGRSPPPGRGAS